MTSNLGKAGTKKGHDAMHRARKRDTHPTHACSEDFCGFDGMRIASFLSHRIRTRAFPPFLAMADSIATGAER